MMTPESVLADLTRRGVRVQLQDDPLHPLLLMPGDRIPFEMKWWLGEHKFELAALLDLHGAHFCSRAADVPSSLMEGSSIFWSGSPKTGRAAVAMSTSWRRGDDA